MLRGRLNSLQPQQMVAPAANIAAHDHHVSRLKLKLPQIPMPSYGHKDGEDLHKFFLNFENIILKYELSEYDKFLYLQGQLSGEPLTLVKSLDVGSQCYSAAKELLTRAFASKITQQFEAIKRMAAIKFSDKAPYEFIGKLRQIQEAFKSLNITEDIVLQYFFWNCIPEDLQNQFINISNSNRPSLVDLDLHMFSAMERYLDSSKRRHARKDHAEDINSMAVSMNQFRSQINEPKTQFCSLCSNGNNKVTSHSTYNCTVYPSTEDKLGKLRQLSGCTKCGNVTHMTNECQFKFRRA